jgi:hypothetical protein
VRPVCGAPGARVSFYPAVAQAPSSPGVPHSPSARPSHANSGFGVPPTQFGPPHARDARCRWYRHSAAAGGQRGKPRRRGGPGAQPDPRPKPPRRAVRRACTSSCCHNNDLLNCRSWAPRQTRDSIANRCTTRGKLRFLNMLPLKEQRIASFIPPIPPLRPSAHRRHPPSCSASQRVAVPTWWWRHCSLHVLRSHPQRSRPAAESSWREEPRQGGGLTARR